MASPCEAIHLSTDVAIRGTAPLKKICVICVIRG